MNFHAFDLAGMAGVWNSRALGWRVAVVSACWLRGGPSCTCQRLRREEQGPRHQVPALDPLRRPRSPCFPFSTSAASKLSRTTSPRSHKTALRMQGCLLVLVRPTIGMLQKDLE